MIVVDAGVKSVLCRNIDSVRVSIDQIGMVKSNFDPQSKPPHCLSTVETVQQSKILTRYQVRNFRNVHSRPTAATGYVDPRLVGGEAVI